MKEELPPEQATWICERYPELGRGAGEPEGPLGRIKLSFAMMYAFCKTSLPDEDVACRRAGRIMNAIGLYLAYRFDSEDGREFLEFFASHRMTNDRLYRIYEDGSVELVGASMDLAANLDEETRRMERQFYERVRRHGFIE